MIGKIINIKGGRVIVKLSIDIEKQVSLLNLHVSFEDGPINIIGEITEINNQEAIINIIGEIKTNDFVAGITKKPSFKSTVRIINGEELKMIIGNINDIENKFYLGKSNVYPTCNVSVDINDFFSNHFAILGNTGSGKSCGVARILQNYFAGKNSPVNANIFLFDAYGEYTNAFSKIKTINPKLNFKTYTTNVNNTELEKLNIPLWLLDVDDLAILLDVDDPNQLPIIEKALNLVAILSSSDVSMAQHKNDIIARSMFDILTGSGSSTKAINQIIAILTHFNTEDLGLDSKIIEPGYIRTLRQCLFVDNNGQIKAIESIIEFIRKFISNDLQLSRPELSVPYTLTDLEFAMDFALISEGALQSESMYELGNVLKVRLHTLANTYINEFFTEKTFITRADYINKLFTTKEGEKCQIVDFNINYVDDRIAKAITKILSKMLFDHATESDKTNKKAYLIIIEEAHRYVQVDNDLTVLGYNIFDRITKEGRKYGVLLGLITQRPSELSETAVSQCANFIIFRTLHPKDLGYIKEMVPNVSNEIADELKILQPGNCMAFGSAFKIPLTLYIELPDPTPYSTNANIKEVWYNK